MGAANEFGSSPIIRRHKVEGLRHHLKNKYVDVVTMPTNWDKPTTQTQEQ